MDYELLFKRIRFDFFDCGNVGIWHCVLPDCGCLEVTVTTETGLETFLCVCVFVVL